jgi:hypothetical protein
MSVNALRRAAFHLFSFLTTQYCAYSESMVSRLFRFLAYSAVVGDGLLSFALRWRFDDVQDRLPRIDVLKCKD